MNYKTKFFNTNLVYFIILLLFVIVRIVTGAVDLSFMSEEVNDVVFSVIIQIVLMFLLPIFLFSKLQKQKVRKTFSDFKYKAISPLAIIYSILIGACCYLLNIAISSFFGGLIGLFGYEKGAGVSSGIANTSFPYFILQVVLVAVLPAICEETTHRGLLIHGYSMLGIKRAVIYSSLMFGLMHLNINQFFYATILGFLIALSTLMSKSIIPAMIIHFMNNFISTYISFAQSNKWFGYELFDLLDGMTISGNLISSFITSFVFLIIVMGALVALYMLLIQETRVKQMKQLFKTVKKINEENGTTPPAMSAGDGYLQNLAMLNSMLMDYNVKGNTMEQNVFSVAESKYHKPKLTESVLFYAAVVLGTIVTVFTFIWGIL